MTSLDGGGRLVDDWEHIRDCIERILTTPLGSRVLRRDFGSEVPRLVDAPMNAKNLMKLQWAVVNALTPRLVRGFWYGEPRIKVVSVEVHKGSELGAVVLAIWVVERGKKRANRVLIEVDTGRKYVSE